MNPSPANPLTDSERAVANVLVNEHRDMAHRLAYQFRGPRWIRREDLEAVALDAIVECARRFNPARGTKFKTFVRRRMLGAIQDHARDLRRFRLKPRPTTVNISAIGKGAPCYADKGDMTFADMRQEDPSASCAREEFWGELRRRLTRVEYSCLALYYRDGMLMRDVGHTLGMSESRVSQIVAQTLAQLKKCFAENPDSVGISA